jgi:hypothetical protein
LGGVIDERRKTQSGDLETAKAYVRLAVELLHEAALWQEECDGLFGQLSIMTEILVNEHWPAIERVAHGLLDFSTLNGADVDDLIAGHVLDVPENENGVREPGEM